jgi:hypothetical protein
MGVSGEHEIDEMASGVGDDVVGVVRLVGHKENWTVGFCWDSQIQIGVAGTGVVNATEPKAGTSALDWDMLIDQNGDSVGGKGLDDKRAVEGDVVVAEDGVA